jgi:hypothetical protein
LVQLVVSVINIFVYAVKTIMLFVYGYRVGEGAEDADNASNASILAFDKPKGPPQAPPLDPRLGAGKDNPSFVTDGRSAKASEAQMDTDIDNAINGYIVVAENSDVGTTPGVKPAVVTTKPAEKGESVPMQPMDAGKYIGVFRYVQC